MIILLILFSIFAPLFTPVDPNFQHDITVAKLLPPLSMKTIVKIESNEEVEPIDEFIRMRRNVKPALNDEYIYVVDEYTIENGISLIQNGSRTTITQSYLEDNKMGLEINQILFLLGTDEYGRDIFSRIIYGTRLSLLIGFFSVVISFVIGISLGFISGFSGGIADTVLNRIAEMFMAFPMIFLIILIVAFFGSSLTVIIIVLGFSGWMDLFKIIRGEVLSLKSKDFIVTAKMLGQSKYKILYREMFPLMLSPIIVHLVLQYSNVIIAESALSYLGLGLGNQYASWGSMIEAGQYYLSQAWWMSFSPCLFLFITLVSLNHLGKKMEGLLDPRLS
ncbi:ABC transporter permease [Bacteroidota bacterium]